MALLSRALSDLGASNRAITTASHARNLATQLGMERICQEVIPSELDGSLAFMEAVTSTRNESVQLTQSEARVAALAAQGQKNTEIAEKLYVTVSTVEQHLTRIYRKLGVTGRSDLATMLDIDARHASWQRETRSGSD